MLVASATSRDDKLADLEMHIRTLSKIRPDTALDTDAITPRNIGSINIILEEVLMPEETRRFAQSLLNRFEESDDNLHVVASLIILRAILPQRPHGMHITLTSKGQDCNECFSCQNHGSCGHKKHVLTWYIRVGQNRTKKLGFSAPSHGRPGWDVPLGLARLLSQLTNPNVKQDTLDDLYSHLNITAIVLGKYTPNMPVIYNSELLPADTADLTVALFCNKVDSLVNSIYETGTNYKLTDLSMRIRNLTVTLQGTAFETSGITPNHINAVSSILKEVPMPEETKQFAQSLLSYFEDSDDRLHTVAALVILRAILPQRPRNMHITFVPEHQACNECTNCQNYTACSEPKYVRAWDMRIGQNRPERIEFFASSRGRLGWDSAMVLGRILAQLTALQKTGLKDVERFSRMQSPPLNLKQAALDCVYIQLGIASIIEQIYFPDEPKTYNTKYLSAGTETLTISQLYGRVVNSLSETAHV